MTTTIKLPELGENVDSGELTKILVSAGDRVSKDQALLELETDKATIEVPSPVAGTIKELHVQEGRKIKVGDTLFTIEESGDGAQQKQKAQKGRTFSGSIGARSIRTRGGERHDGGSGCGSRGKDRIGEKSRSTTGAGRESARAASPGGGETGVRAGGGTGSGRRAAARTQTGSSRGFR